MLASSCIIAVTYFKNETEAPPIKKDSHIEECVENMGSGYDNLQKNCSYALDGFFWVNSVNRRCKF